MDLEAWLLLADDRVRTGDQHDILSPDQMELREYREIAMDPALFNAGLTPGLYRRAHADWPKRPGRWWSQVEDPPFDNRVGMTGNQLGFDTASTPFEDPEWPPAPPTHLDRYQRCRIRRVLRDVPPGHTRLRSLTRWVLAAKYGVRISDILRLE